MARRRKRSSGMVGCLPGFVVVSVLWGLVLSLTPGEWAWIIMATIAVAGAVFAWGILLRRRVENKRAAAEALARAIAEDLDSLLALSPGQFETAAAAVLSAYGYRVEHTGKTGDRGIDLKATNSQGMVTAVQCKQYALHRAVGGPEVRNLHGAAAQARADGAMFITTARFTREAQVAAAQLGIQLVDGATLTQWARAARPLA